MFNKENTPPKSISSNTSSKFDTLIGKNTKVNGDLSFSGILNLDGTISGSLLGSKNDDVLYVSETGVVEGKIEVANIIVNGTIKGDVVSTGKIEVAPKANIQGNVYYKSIEMETGSKINGQLIYQESDAPNKITKIDDKKAK